MCNIFPAYQIGRSRNSLHVVISALLIHFLSYEFALAQTKAESPGATSVIIGSCNLVLQNVTVAKEGTLINELDCPGGNINDRFRLRYLWLDDVNTSFLIAGHFDKSLSRLVGGVPLIVKNEIYQRAMEIVGRFGDPINSRTDILMEQTGFEIPGRNKENLQIPSEEFANIPVSVLRKMKIYTGGNDILLPDAESLKTVLGTNEWPQTYKMTYGFEDVYDLNFRKDRIQAENGAISCVVLHKAVPREQLDTYWDDVEKLEQLFVSKELNSLEAFQYKVGRSNLRRAIANNPAIEAMIYFGEQYWPEDFLIGIGDLGLTGCGADPYNVGFRALPRHIYTH